MLETKAKRTSAPKSRNGCLTCKNRRLKCDETRPNCNACVKSSRACQWKRPLPKVQRILLPQDEVLGTSLTKVRPSGSLPFVDPREAYYFWAYQDEAALELSGFRKSTAWTRAMLQTCRTEPFVLRALVAIGALNKSVKMSHAAAVEPFTLGYNNQVIANQHREFALASYDKAIIGMRQIIPTPDRTSSLRKALIACLLVHCIESYLRNPITANDQAQAGYHLLHQWIGKREYRAAGIESPDSAVIEDDIFREFARQDLHNAMFWGEKLLERSQLGKIEGTSTIQNMPSVFSDLEEAKLYQDLIMRRTFRLIGEAYASIIAVKRESGHAYTVDTPGELIDPCYVPEMLLSECDAYTKDIRRWCRAFQPLFDRSIASTNTDASLEASLLRVNALDSEISLAAAFFTDECSFDTYYPDFKEIITLSQFMKSKTKSSKPQPVFNLAIGVEKSLYTVALYCRERSLRHEALSILRSRAPHDPTKWWFRLVTRAAYIVGLEEQGRLDDGTIPENARYRLIFILNHWFEESKDCTLLCARRVGYPLGKAYPAKREWQCITFSQVELENLFLAEDISSQNDTNRVTSWPPTIHKPECVKWAEVHDELFRTVKVASPPD